MAAYFQLISKETGEAVSFNQIDEEMCAYFKQPVDEDKYLCNWYNSIGWRVAMGKSLVEVAQEFIAYGPEASDLLQITNWLIERYTTDSWIGR